MRYPPNPLCWKYPFFYPFTRGKEKRGRKSPLPPLLKGVVGISFVIGHLTLVIVFFGCEKAEGPIVFMDLEALKSVNKIAILPVTNATPHDAINPLIDQILTDEMLKLKGYSFATPAEVREAILSFNLSEEKVSNPMDAKAVGEKLGVDGVMGLMLISYLPSISQIAELKTETDVKAHTFEETKEELKEEHGVLWGFLVDLLIPDVWVKGDKEHKYGTVTTDPIIGMGVTLVETQSGRVIYQASKFLKKDTRLPEAYRKKYEEIISKEKFQLLDFIARLSIRELIHPLNTSRS